MTLKLASVYLRTNYANSPRYILRLLRPTNGLCAEKREQFTTCRNMDHPVSNYRRGRITCRMNGSSGLSSTRMACSNQLIAGKRTQEWIQAGDGAFSYDPPLLTLYWDSGATARLLVVESGPERLVFHHGRNLAPLNNQEPDEVFSRQKTEKGPVKKPS